jgi:hypothetical protein
MSVLDGEFGFATWQGTINFESTPTVGLGAGISHEFNESFAVCWPSNNAFRGSGKGYGQIVFDLTGVSEPAIPAGAKISLTWAKSDNSLRICQTPEGLTGNGDGATVLNTPGLFEVRVLEPGVAMAQADVFAGAAVGVIGGSDAGTTEVVVPSSLIAYGDALGIRLLIAPLFEADWAGWTCKGGFDRTGIESFIALSADGNLLEANGAGWLTAGVVGVQDGANHTFTLNGSVAEVSDVYVNGLQQSPTSWEFDDLSGEISTLGWAPVETDIVEARHRLL